MGFLNECILSESALKMPPAIQGAERDDEGAEGNRAHSITKGIAGLAAGPC